MANSLDRRAFVSGVLAALFAPRVPRLAERVPVGPVPAIEWPGAWILDLYPPRGVITVACDPRVPDGSDPSRARTLLVSFTARLMPDRIKITGRLVV